MKYKLITRVNPQDRSQAKWYASSANDGNKSKTDLAKEIAAISSFSLGDISNVIENVLESISFEKSE